MKVNPFLYGNFQFTVFELPFSEKQIRSISSLHNLTRKKLEHCIYYEQK